MTSSRQRPGRQSQPPADSVAERMTAVPELTRGGEDVRRRGWFWHWNALVTQYAPLLGLKGVGLLNSYTVWTDRREESPHRGYAFPSQQSEADFYGEDRAELITINKILVALDLIEIRKEMVLRVDPQGRRWKVPHNFYRVKDHGDDFTLSTGDVLRVAALAASDGAVYRYVRRVFSPRFAPIDGDNVWTRILPEVATTPVWQALAARAAAEEARASRRTRAGHATRKGDTPLDVAPDSPVTPPFFVPTSGAGTANDSADNDSHAVANESGAKTSVEPTNNGSAVDVDGSNSGLGRERRTSVGPGNTAKPTDVEPSNTTYHQFSTTTKDEIRMTGSWQGDEAGRREGGKAGRREEDSAVTSDDSLTWQSASAATSRARGTRGAPVSGPGASPPDDAPGEIAALRAFESANDRAATPAERKLLRDLAARCESLAAAARQERDDVPGSGWAWLEAAVWEAVDAGSAFVAPRRLREILARWERDGFPDRRDPGQPPPEPRGGAPRPRPRSDVASPTQREEPVFIIAEVGLSNRQVWAATLAEVTRRGGISRGDLETWLRPASLVGREGETLLIGAPNAVARDRIATRLLTALREALTATIGVPVPVAVVMMDETVAHELGEGGREPERGVG